MRFLLLSILILSITQSLFAQSDTSSALLKPVSIINSSEIAPNDSSKPRMVKRWVSRDSNAIWKHDGPDTGRIMLIMKPNGYFDGHLFSRDSNWIILISENGLKQEIEAPHVKGVMDWTEVPDTFKSKRPKASVELRERFEVYIAPAVLGGVTLPSTGTIEDASWTAGAAFIFHIPHFLYYQRMGGFVAAGIESKSFVMHDDYFDDEDFWSVQYLTLTPGFSFLGIVNLGVNLGFPISSQLTDYPYYYQTNFAEYGSIRSGIYRLLVEPTIVFSIPLHYYTNNTLLLLIQGSYPLGNTFINNIPTNSLPISPGAIASLGSLRLPEIMLGVSYVLSLRSQSQMGF